MPWRTTSVMDERIKFVIEASKDESTMSQLCRDFGISRPTGYRWLSRYREFGSVLSLFDRSRRPHHSPTRTSQKIEGHVLVLRRWYGWGARKLRELLLREGIEVKVSTINRILKRNGLIEQKKRCYSATGRFERSNPNELWQMDFKGEFTMSQGKCFPLTLVDDHSRFALGVFALPSIHGDGCATLVAAFIWLLWSPRGDTYGPRFSLVEYD
ncbi:MAG: leucine zipper domain-containing protein [candidate division Zixibacteria bacterium]